MPELVENSSKCLSWWEGSEALSEEKAGYSLQVQVRAPLRPAPAGNANPGLKRSGNYFAGYAESLVSALTGCPWNRLANTLRMGQETMSSGIQGHWKVQEPIP